MELNEKAGLGEALMAESATAYDASDSIAENNLRQDQSRYAREDADTLRVIMLSTAGRAWLYRLLNRCHIFGDTFAGEQTHITAFQQGQENIGRQLWLDVQNASLDLYVKMIKEQKDEEARLEKLRRKDEKRRKGEDEAPITPESQFPDLPPPGQGKPPGK